MLFLRHSGFVVAIAAVGFGALLSSSAFADGTLRRGMTETARIGSGLELSGCGGNDPTCEFAIMRLASGINFVHPAVTGGLALPFDSNSADTSGVGGVRIEAVHANLPLGDLHVGTFEAVFLPGSSGMRLRFTLGQSDAFFFCTDRAGRAHLPFVGRNQVRCRPDASWGGGVQLAELQWDPATGRFAGRWAQFNGVFNFFENGNGMNYVRRHVNGMLGVSAESVWHGSTPHASTGSTHQLRALMGISGMVRSADAKWDFNADFIFRPSIIGTAGAFSNVVWDARARFMRNFLISQGQQEGQNALISAGIETAFSYNQVPSDSIGPFASDREPYSLYVGATLGVSFEFAHY